MRKCSLCLGLLAGLLLVASISRAQDNPRPKKKNKDDHSRVASDDDYKALGKYKEVVGRLLSLDANLDPGQEGKDGLTQQMTLRVEYPALELKPGKSLNNPQMQKQIQALLRQQQQAQREYQQILRIRNPIQQQQRLMQLFNRLMQQQANAAQKAMDPRNSPFRTVTFSVTFDLPIREKVKVARAKLDVEYDDKGNVIEYTKEELKKRKDPDMPGYKATFDDLQPGQLIKVYLAKPKSAEKKKEKAKDDAKAGEAADKAKAADLLKPDVKDPAAKDKEKSKDETPPEEYRPEVRMILILTDADPSTLPQQSPGRDKKKKQQ
jgi:hypothetical protein